LVSATRTDPVGCRVGSCVGSPRSSAGLAASLISTTYAGHRFREEEDDLTRRQQRVDFFKSLALVGTS